MSTLFSQKDALGRAGGNEFSRVQQLRPSFQARSEPPRSIPLHQVSWKNVRMNDILINNGPDGDWVNGRAAAASLQKYLKILYLF